MPWRGYRDFQDRVGLLWIVREWAERNPYLPELAGDDRQGDERTKKMSNLSRLVELLPWLTVRNGKVSKILRVDRIHQRLFILSFVNVAGRVNRRFKG